MRNGLLLWFCCLFYFSVANADSKSALSIEKKILSFHLEPSAPKVGQKISFFLQAHTGITKNELVAEALLDDSTIKLTNTGSSLWAAAIKPFSEVKVHQLKVNLFLRDSQEASRLKNAINQLKQEVESLNAQIDLEADPVKKLALESLRDQKQNYQNELEASLDGIKSYLKTETFDFVISGDDQNPNFPVLVGVSPNASPLAKRIRVTLTGENFPANPNVKFSGQNATIISQSTNAIEVLAPNFSVTGEKTIEVTFPATETEPKKNAVLANSFFVSDRAILKNLRPVAVTTGYQKVAWPLAGPAVLQGDNSYDENGDVFSFEWTVQKSPTGSAFSTGTLLENIANPSFIPDKIGIYTIKLRLLETTTEELLTSYISTVTVEVK